MFSFFPSLFPVFCTLVSSDLLSEDSPVSSKDWWVWNDLSHVSVQLESKSDCDSEDAPEFGDLFDSTLHCFFSVRHSRLIGSSIARTPRKLRFANLLIVDCLIPESVQMSLRKNETSLRISQDGSFDPRWSSLRIHLGNVLPKREQPRSHQITACLMVDSREYVDSDRWRRTDGSHWAMRLPEWIEWHIMHQWLDHVFVYYVPNPLFDLRPLLEPFQPWFTLVPWVFSDHICNKRSFFGARQHRFRGNAQWSSAMASCLARFAQPTSEFTLLMDTDELLWLERDGRADVGGLRRLLSNETSPFSSLSFQSRLAVDCEQLRWMDTSNLTVSTQASLISQSRCLKIEAEPSRKRQLVHTDTVRSVNQFFISQTWNRNQRIPPQISTDLSRAFVIHQPVSLDHRAPWATAGGDGTVQVMSEDMLKSIRMLHARLAGRWISQIEQRSRENHRRMPPAPDNLIFSDPD